MTSETKPTNRNRRLGGLSLSALPPSLPGCCSNDEIRGFVRAEPVPVTYNQLLRLRSKSVRLCSLTVSISPLRLLSEAHGRKDTSRLEDGGGGGSSARRSLNQRTLGPAPPRHRQPSTLVHSTSVPPPRRLTPTPGEKAPGAEAVLDPAPQLLRCVLPPGMLNHEPAGHTGSFVRRRVSPSPALLP